MSAKGHEKLLLKKVEEESGTANTTKFDFENLYEQKLLRSRKADNETIELPFFISLDSKSVLNRPITPSLQGKVADVGPFDTSKLRLLKSLSCQHFRTTTCLVLRTEN